MRIHKLQVNAAQETKEAASGNAECSGAGEGRKKKSLKFKRMLALALCGMLLAVSSAVPVLASSGSSGTEIDSSTVSALLDLVKQAAGLFTVFPINIFLIGSLIGLGFVIFRKAKGVAKS